MSLECLSCHGTYDPIQGDGVLYFHVCPPLSAVELAAAVDAGTITLPEGETVEQAIDRRLYRRPNERNENPVIVRGRSTGAIVSEGAGVREIPDRNARPDA